MIDTMFGYKPKLSWGYIFDETKIQKEEFQGVFYDDSIDLAKGLAERNEANGLGYTLTNTDWEKIDSFLRMNGLQVEPQKEDSVNG